MRWKIAAHPLVALWLLASSARTEPPSPVAPSAAAPPAQYPPTQPPATHLAPDYPPGTYPHAAHPPPQPPGAHPAYPPGAYPSAPNDHRYRYPSMQPPYELPYKRGQPVPAGYRLVEEPRWGLVTAGWVTSAVGYGVPLLIASSTRFENESTWLAVPFAGPWLTLGLRKTSCRNAEEARQDPDAGSGLRCLGDLMLGMLLIADGIVQIGGGTMLLLGYTLHKKKLVRHDLAIFVAPQRIGSGYGLGVAGGF